MMTLAYSAALSFNFASLFAEALTTITLNCNLLSDGEYQLKEMLGLHGHNSITKTKYLAREELKFSSGSRSWIGSPP